MLSAQRANRASNLERQKEMEGKFDTLCGNITECVENWNSSLDKVLKLKNDLLLHNLPPSLVLRLTLICSELFRSQSDMVVPVEELVRLVHVYKAPLIDKSIALKRIEDENERKKADLNIAVKKLEQYFTLERQYRREHTLNNWEKLFCKSTLNRTHGRRWKFVIGKVKQRAELGLSVYNPLADDDDEATASRIIAPRFHYGSTTASSPQPSTLAISNGETPKLGSSYRTSIVSTKQSSLLSSSLRLDNTSTVGETEDDDLQDEDQQSDNEESPLSGLSKRTRSPTLMSRKSNPPQSRSPVPRRREMKDASVSTEDVEYNKLLRVQIYQPIGLKVEAEDISCTLSLLGILHNSQYLEKGDTSFEEFEFLFEGQEFAKLGEKRGTDVDDMMEEECSEQLDITVHTGGDRNMFALSTIPLEDLSDTAPAVPQYVSDDDIVPKPFPIYALEGDVTAPCGYLPIYGVWELHEKMKFSDKACETDLIPPDDDEIESYTKVSSVSPALSRKSVSVMIPTPKPIVTPSPEPDILIGEYTDKRELAEMAMSHAEEMEKLQCEYESRLESMAQALELLRASNDQQTYRAKTPHTLQAHLPDTELSDTPVSLMSTCFSNTRPNSGIEPHHSATKIPTVALKQRAQTTEPPRRRKMKWGDDLPQDFFERMDYFAQSSMVRHQDLIQKIRFEVQRQTEEALATQHRLSRDQVQSADSGITEDVSLPAIFMPSKNGVVFSPKARKYFHPPGSREPRLSQPPSVFRLPNMGSTPVLNLFDLSQKNVVQKGPGWLYKTCKDVTKR